MRLALLIAALCAVVSIGAFTVAIVKVAADEHDAYSVFMWAIGALGAMALITAVLLIGYIVRG